MNKLKNTTLNWLKGWSDFCAKGKKVHSKKREPSWILGKAFKASDHFSLFPHPITAPEGAACITLKEAWGWGWGTPKGRGKVPASGPQLPTCTWCETCRQQASAPFSLPHNKSEYAQQSLQRTSQLHSFSTELFSFFLTPMQLELPSQ